MEVHFAPRRIRRVERVTVKGPLVTRGAHAARTVALLLCLLANGVGKTGVELLFDPGALGAEVIGLQLGN